MVMKARKSNSFYTKVVAILITISIYSCVSVKGPATQLQTSPGFVPKKVYSYSYDTMWDKVLAALRREKIMVASANKESGIITTDFISGWTVDVAAISKRTYRYMYQIALEKINSSQTRVEVTCKLEEKEFLKGGEAREAMEQLRPYEDVTYKMKKEAEQFEFWLYEQIEKSF